MSKVVETLENKIKEVPEVIQFSKEKVKYWVLQRYLNYCYSCKKNNLCYPHEDCMYEPKTMFEVCPHESMKKVIRMLGKLDPMDNALNGTEFDAMDRIVDEIFKQKVIRI